MVEDPEFTIRLHLFQLYYTLFNDIDDPFPDLTTSSRSYWTVTISVLTGHLHLLRKSN
ncbi:hypothetical protein [Secundilactobacillus paracollinoides]|uniref:hypothetical protein n=1 Tax=Secundilactobacillus paracollinoides TaxID=240427 RepID=UPI0012E183A6|nr:hypothetical protein [Secundilactobacillus paracollinoides]